LSIPRIFLPGIATYEFWLKTGIVLLGARFVLGDILKLGGISLVLVIVEIAVSLALMTLLGKVFRLRPKLTTLLAVGSSICGVSAIIATKGAIDADDEDSSFAIAAILALGACGVRDLVFAICLLPLGYNPCPARGTPGGTRLANGSNLGKDHYLVCRSTYVISQPRPRTILYACRLHLTSVGPVNLKLE